MQDVITTYKITTTYSYMMGEQGEGYSLYPHASSMYYEGYDDGGKDYLIPQGYTVEKCKTGALEFFDADNIACPIVTQNGLPAIVGRSSTIILRPLA